MKTRKKVKRNNMTSQRKRQFRKARLNKNVKYTEDKTTIDELEAETIANIKIAEGTISLIVNASDKSNAVFKQAAKIHQNGLNLRKEAGKKRGGTIKEALRQWLGITEIENQAIADADSIYHLLIGLGGKSITSNDAYTMMSIMAVQLEQLSKGLSREYTESLAVSIDSVRRMAGRFKEGD